MSECAIAIAASSLAIAAVAMTGFAAVASGSRRGYRATRHSLPSTVVKRGDVTFTVSAKGELQGGNSEMLSAPMTGGGPVAITFLRGSGELVKEGDVVVAVRHDRAGLQAS